MPTRYSSTSTRILARVYGIELRKLRGRPRYASRLLGERGKRESDHRPDALAQHKARGDDEHVAAVRARVVVAPAALHDRTHDTSDGEVGRQIHRDAD